MGFASYREDIIARFQEFEASFSQFSETVARAANSANERRNFIRSTEEWMIKGRTLLDEIRYWLEFLTSSAGDTVDQFKLAIAQRKVAQDECVELRERIAKLGEASEYLQDKLDNACSANEKLHERIRHLKNEKKALSQKLDDAILKNFDSILDAHGPISPGDKFK